VNARPQAADLRQALIAETLDEVAHLHDTVQALAPKLQTMADPIVETITEALTRAKKEVSEHAREQTTYVEQTMLRDRETFVTEQKAALQALDTSLRKRDAGIVKIMADILQKARADFAGELTQAIDKNAAHRRKKEKNRAALAGLALGLVVGVAGTMGTLIILLRLGIVGVVGGGQ